MQRRTFLAGAGSVGIAATAGCTSLGSATTISNPTERRGDDGETSLQFRTDDGDRVATVTVHPGNRRYDGSGGAQVPVDVAITHGDETKITGLEFDLRAPPSGGSPAEVAIETPFGTPHPSMDLYADPEDASTVFAIDDLGEQGDGTLVFKFLLTGLRERTSELSVAVTVDVAAEGLLGGEYTLDGLTLVPLPPATA